MRMANMGPEGQKNTSSNTNSSASELKKQLLKWCKESLEGTGVDVNNFKKDWTDGRALLGILHTQTDGEVPGWEGSESRDVRTNLEAGFAGADSLGVGRLLLVEDLARCHENNTDPDELSVMTYVAELRSALMMRAASKLSSSNTPEPAPEPVVPPEPKECENCKRLQEELDALKKHLEESQANLKELTEKAEKQCEELKKALDDAAQEREKNAETRQQQQKEFFDARDELMKTCTAIDEKNKELIKELENARRERDDALKSAAKEKEDAENSREELMKTNKSLEEKDEELKSALKEKEDVDKSRDELMEKCKSLEEENEEGMAQKLAEILSKDKEELYRFGVSAKTWILENKNNIVLTKKIIDLLEEKE